MRRSRDGRSASSHGRHDTPASRRPEPARRRWSRSCRTRRTIATAIAKMLSCVADALQTQPHRAVFSRCRSRDRGDERGFGPGHGAGAAGTATQALRLGRKPAAPAVNRACPIRLGPRLLGALVRRWPVDRTPPARCWRHPRTRGGDSGAACRGMQSVARETPRRPRRRFPSSSARVRR